MRGGGEGGRGREGGVNCDVAPCGFVFAGFGTGTRGRNHKGSRVAVEEEEEEEVLLTAYNK